MCAAAKLRVFPIKMLESQRFRLAPVSTHLVQRCQRCWFYSVAASEQFNPCQPLSKFTVTHAGPILLHASSPREQ